MWGGLTQDYVKRIDRYSISNELFNVNHVKKHLHKHKKLCTPKSSKVHYYVKVTKQPNKAKFLFKGSGTIHES